MSVSDWRNTKRLLWWLIAGTRGGVNRARIINTLHKRPYNANQLAELLNLDYKTVRHHLDFLMKHEVIIQQGEGYGSVFFLSSEIEENFDNFREIWEQIGKSGIGEDIDTE
ncbi:MAG: winged helix-turn-helix domain-containing protein [Candidatus Thorarchaeota archaeon]